MRRILITTLATAAMISFAHAQTVTTTETEVFVTAQPTDVLSSNVVGLNVSDAEGTVFGEIKDLIVSDNELAGYIVSVGGFLGIGEKYVIVSPQSVNITYVADDKSWQATMSATKEEIEKAPEFKYVGRWEK
ncbi:PRC-barrel domain-containing protein [Paenochrobactrum glaciei]|uniref:PRC-barrel domain-containing protein n=1 Tax=Paenochrobactrum glaciei TaxID=486407 RepID=A0ABP3RDX6_9HYPH